jgi:ABC-type transport system involved in multi-copper enzyme maturation permease subunit
MWKVVKAELSYMKTEFSRSKVAYSFFVLVFLVFVVNILHAYFAPTHRAGVDFSHYSVMMSLIILSFIPVIYILFQVQLMIREHREKRVRLQCLLPATIREIGYARLMTPFILLVGTSIITVVILAVYIIVKPEDPPEVRDVLNSQKSWLPLVFIPLTYGLRLFSERIGIIIGSLYLGIMVLGSIYIGGGDDPEYIIPLFHDFVEYINNPVSFIVMTILFCMIIHLSFIARKSYLR